MFGIAEEDKQMLYDIRNDQRWLVKAVKAMREEAVSEEGYKRCVRHKAAVDTLAKEVGESKTTFKWIKRTAVGGLIAMITVGCAAAAQFMLGGG